MAYLKGSYRERARGRQKGGRKEGERERESEEERKNERNFCPLTYSPNDHNARSQKLHPGIP